MGDKKYSSYIINTYKIIHNWTSFDQYKVEIAVKYVPERWKHGNIFKHNWQTTFSTAQQYFWE